MLMINDRYWSVSMDGEEEEPRAKLEILPLLVLFLNVLVRTGVIATRHGTTPETIYDRMEKVPMTPEDYQESLILLAWTISSPTNIMPEITKTMSRLGIPE